MAGCLSWTRKAGIEVTKRWQITLTKDFQDVLEPVDRCYGFGKEDRCLLTEPQSPATIARNFFMNFSFDNTQLLNRIVQ